MCELLWSDPQPQLGRGPSKRGVGLSFGEDVTKRFLQENNLGKLLPFCPFISCCLHLCLLNSYCRSCCPVTRGKGWGLWNWTRWEAYNRVFCSKLLWSGNVMRLAQFFSHICPLKWHGKERTCMVKTCCRFHILKLHLYFATQTNGKLDPDNLFVYTYN